MKAYVVAKGVTEIAILRAVLPTEVLTVSALVAAGDRSNLGSVARTLLVTRRKPLAALVETRSTDESVVRERWQSTQEFIAEVAAGVPVKVILLVPQIEILFFQAPGVIPKVFGQPAANDVSALARADPREALAQLLKSGTGPRTLDGLLDALGDREIEALRSTEPIRELLTFLTHVAEDSAKPAAS